MTTPHDLQNYLRMHRKQSGLTQDEVAFLLGYKNGGHVSRYERRRRLPPLETALACEAIFGIPVAAIFAGVRQGVARDVAKRRTELRATLITQLANARRANITQHKLRWLGEDEAPSVVTNAGSIE